MAENKKSITTTGSVISQPCYYWGYNIITAMGDISTAATIGSVQAAGSGYVTGEAVTLSGGVNTTPTALLVATTKLVSTGLNAPGTGYATGNTITLAGGTSSVAAILTLSSTQLVSSVLNAAGTGYAPAMTLTTAGGTASTHATVTVSTTKAVSATVAAGGAGDLGDGAGVIVEGTTGTGTKFRASVTITTNAIASVQSISTAGSYTVNPTDITQEPVIYISGAASGTALTGAKLSVVMGVDTFAVTAGGTYTVENAALTQNGATTPAGGTGLTLQTSAFGVRAFTVSTAGSYTGEVTTFTQASTNGAGTGATFNAGLFGVLTATISVAGAYTTTPADPVAQLSSTGSGTGATFNMTWSNVVAAGATIYDSTSAVGTIVDVIPDNALAGTQKTFTTPIRCTTGLYASVAGSGAILFLYD